jgi:F0F1-type ATP synthase membrane subunit b/b'
MNESFVISLSFILLVALVYKKLAQNISQYLDGDINKVDNKIKEAVEINFQAQKIFSEAQEQFVEFEKIKEHKLHQAIKNAEQARKKYVEDTQRVLDLKAQEFSQYLQNFQAESLHKARLRVAELTHKTVVEAIMLEKFNISNRLN